MVEWSATRIAFSPDDKQVVAAVLWQGKQPKHSCEPTCTEPEIVSYDIQRNGGGVPLPGLRTVAANVVLVAPPSCERKAFGTARSCADTILGCGLVR